MPTELRWRPSRDWLRCALALLLLWAGAAQGQGLESMLAPGTVSQAHAKTEHECKACHARFDRNAQDGLCLRCHKDVGADIRAHLGLHGRRDPQPCRACHTEHKGRDAKIAAFDHETFDHHLTDFELHDKHVGVDCAKCHLPGKRFREAGNSCVSCHTHDDVHRGGLGPKCESCHSARGWKEVRFDHDKQTRFALDGKHADAKCSACHQNNQFKDTPRACVACHRKDDAHKGRFGEKCESCHSAASWKTLTFDHNRDTRYPLKARHREVKCAACHVGDPYRDKLDTDCVACHRNDDKHRGTLGTNCANCHNESGWKSSPGFDHDQSRFRLRGAHARATCKDCHVDTLFRQTPNTCIACHRKDDKHRGSLGEACGDCHNDQSWKAGALAHFDHDHTRFPLRNGHAQRTVRCEDCHESPSQFKGTPTVCSACHRRDDRHEGTLGTRCEQCHTDASWKIARFDHARTHFPLAGRHLAVACRACHVSLHFKEAPSDCIGCHRRDDRHHAAFGTACANCHNVRAWSLWDFDHGRRTHFALDGRHRALRCEACHREPAPAGTEAAPLGAACVACHRNEDAHDGRFGNHCEQCHVADDWRSLRKVFGGAPRATLPSPGTIPPPDSAANR